MRGYGAGIDDMKGMGPVDIVRVVEGDLKMSRLVHYHHHGGGRGLGEIPRGLGPSG